MSSGSPGRCMGVPARNWLRRSSSVSTMSSERVATPPTSIAFTRTRGASSGAMLRVMRLSAALADPYATNIVCVMLADREEMLTTAPAPDGVDHPAGRQLGQRQWRDHVEREGARHEALAGVHRGAWHRAARVVDEDVEAAELLGRCAPRGARTPRRR